MIFQNMAQKLPQSKAENKSATVINNKKPRVEIIHKQITAKQPHQTHAQNDMIATKVALTLKEQKKYVIFPNNQQQPHIISHEEAGEEDSPLHEHTKP